MLVYDYWDLSYYQGRLYLYWGPAPALLGALETALFGQSITDGQLLLQILLARAWLGLLVLAWAKERLFPSVPWWPFVCGAAGLALGTPVGILFARPAAYEVALAGAQCGLVGGLYAAIRGLESSRPGAQRRWLALASLAWACAFGSRFSHLLTCGGLVAVTAVAVWSLAPRDRAHRQRSLEALFTPAVVGGIAYGIYNYVRFDSPFDSGLTRQITTLGHRGGLRFLLPNCYTYLLRLPQLTAQFPYVFQLPAARFPDAQIFPSFLSAPPDAWLERVCGLAWGTPWFAFALLPFISLARWRRGSATPDPQRATRRWICAAALVMSTAGFLPCLIWFTSTDRFLFDIASGLAIAATLGLAAAWEWAERPARRRLLCAAAVLSLLVTTAATLTAWVEGPLGNALRSNAPEVYCWLTTC
jgi:hypothetical protein